MKNSRLSHPLVRALASAVALLASGALVVGANWAARNHNIRWDVTAMDRHTLGPQAIQILSALDQDVQVTALWPGTAPEKLHDLFDEFARASGGRVSTEIVDPIQNIGYAARFGNQIDTSAQRVIVQAGKRREELECTESPLTQARLATAIFRATTRESRVYFLSGHDEYDWTDTGPLGLSGLANALAEQNMIASGVELATAGRVPEDCDVLVIAGAKVSPGEEEVGAVRDYLDGGGHLLLMTESAIRTTTGELTERETRMNPTWNELLSGWGVTMGDDVVVDLTNHYGQDIGCPATSRYPAHDKIVKGLGITFFVRPRSIAFSDPKERKVLFAPLVQTLNAETSWAETDSRLYTRFTPGVDVPGPVTIASVLLQAPETWKDGKAWKLVVIGDADFATNQFTERYSNLDLAVNSVTWLATREVLIPNTSDLTPEQKLQMTSGDIRNAVTGLALAPLAAAALGLCIWLRRMRK